MFANRLKLLALSLLVGLVVCSAPAYMKDEIAEISSPRGDAPNHEAFRKYSQLAKLNKADRNATFSLMTAEEKSDMWRTHLRLNLARHPEWTKQQRSIVLEAIALATPALYEVPKDGSWTRQVDEPVKSLTQRALLVFTKEEGAALFSDLGSSEQFRSHHAKPSAPPNCGCAQESDWCTYGCAPANCTVLTWGCGTFGVYPCNGKCAAPPK